MPRRACLLILACLAPPALAKAPKHAEAPVAAKGCAWLGPGYVKLEGTETCVKVGGSVRGEFSTGR